MRSILFTIPLDGELKLGPLGSVPIFGVGLALALWCLFGLAYLALCLRRGDLKTVSAITLAVWGGVAFALFKAAALKQIPVYGYGTMLFFGFLAAGWMAARQLRREGADGEISWDVAMWVFVAGLLGARIFYVIQYAPRFFGRDPVNGQLPGPGEIFFRLINLPDGGLVLYGALLLGPLAYYLFCVRRRIGALALGDIVISSVFVGVMFGRLGCLLHGCCYGDVCALPWSIEFPKDSVPFNSLVDRGLLERAAPHSLPLHPTQIYDSLNALLLALLTYAYYPFRRRSGEVIAIGWMLYPFNRFLIEFLRSDEAGKFGTTLTISQWVSLLLFACGAAYFFWLQSRPAIRQPLLLGATSGEPLPPVSKPSAVEQRPNRAKPVRA